MIKAVICVIFFCFSTGLLYGDIYFWTDETGTKQFTNVAPPLDEPVEALRESRSVFRKQISQENLKQNFTVLKVFDGDTIQVTGLDLIFNVRLVGIDSPEIGYKGQKTQPFGQTSKQYLITLLADKPVTIHSYGTDSYNRQLAEAFVDGKNINLEMIKQGMAEVYRGEQPKKFDSKFYKRAERKARQAGKGIWRQNDAYISPKQWRKDNPRK